MALITHQGKVDTRAAAKSIKGWLEGRKFETKAFEVEGGFAIKARKASVFRAAVGADRAIEIDVRSVGDETQVDVRQGSWKTNAISNVAWIVVTGGANLAISGWSLVVQKDLEAFIRDTLNEMAGGGEVEL